MYLWESHLDISHNPSEHDRYTDQARSNLVDMFSSPRKFVLEIGCSTGATGRYCKEKFPDAVYWGIEPNQDAAKIASTRVDHVLVGLSDDFVLSEQGVGLGQIDGVILADVIEHMYNPWKALASLKPYLASNAEIVTSIPNVRSIWLLNEIASGRFTYLDQGLLDITHIRFFTWKEIVDMMQQCGYQIDFLTYGVDERLWATYQNYKNILPSTVEYENVAVKQVKDENDLLELCSLQYYSRAILIP
ncbi:class I SAM-dependent methyltransferase [Aquirhabdus parva]|uniref:Class I SAM-dependent methyltransferase n=1 Tax=Aquirhabdus parva TaxID=2283318 RepID=A0A345P7Y5_9GAMM|nr:class I SAM-dependent methyltransferase [Aquirhabdus parva]AXI03394.1 class I SAM-dependent methyltransferase [Aquirhabdus parva]